MAIVVRPKTRVSLQCRDGAPNLGCRVWVGGKGEVGKESGSAAIFGGVGELLTDEDFLFATISFLLLSLFSLLALLLLVVLLLLVAVVLILVGT